MMMHKVLNLKNCDCNHIQSTSNSIVIGICEIESQLGLIYYEMLT